MKAAKVDAATGARFSSPPSPSQSPPRLRPLPPPPPPSSLSLLLPLPLPFCGAWVKAELETWLLGLAFSPPKSSTWNRAAPSSPATPPPAPMPAFTTAPPTLRHSARSASMELLAPPRGAFLGSKSTHGGAASALSVFLMPSVLHNILLASTSLDARQDSTSFSTLPPRTSTVSWVSNKWPFCTLRGACAVDHRSNLVPGGKCTPSALADPYSMALNFCSPSARSRHKRRHLPPSKSSWNLTGCVMSTILTTCAKYCPTGRLLGALRARSFGK
mmetsp:Transcript_85120/g.214611  ORF Transcript_85120/g.214611 Transcript_85120/m.214611 type:complete len:273 (-) Transcript_85120:255-1073(-)